MRDERDWSRALPAMRIESYFFSSNFIATPFMQ
jgi:hypothetical protein